VAYDVFRGEYCVRSIGPYDPVNFSLKSIEKKKPHNPLEFICHQLMAPAVAASPH
jgi:hypothetical protein